MQLPRNLRYSGQRTKVLKRMKGFMIVMKTFLKKMIRTMMIMMRQCRIGFVSLINTASILQLRRATLVTPILLILFLIRFSYQSLLSLSFLLLLPELFFGPTAIFLQLPWKEPNLSDFPPFLSFIHHFTQHSSFSSFHLLPLFVLIPASCKIHQPQSNR